ncbi:MAG TPA: glycosyltransferase, partial [Ktedonobacteraceae bacterium]|nr:glycosyltransferase [Ktedonobacteraceae bacterium]
NEGHMAQGGWIAIRCYGGDSLPQARNAAVKQFLEESNAEWLLWIDTDMGFEADIIDRLLEIADRNERPVVGGLCFAYLNTTNDGYGGYDMKIAPTVFHWGKLPSGQTGFISALRYPINDLVKVSGTGSACILIHRSVFTRINDEYGPTWYDKIEEPNSGQKIMISEDLSFCMRCGALNIPVYVHTGVRTTHHKPIWVSEHHYWSQYEAPHSTDQVAVIVPVLNRPQNAKPFMRSLKATTGLARVYAICDSNDNESWEAWRKAGATVVKYQKLGPGPGTFAEKVNFGFKRTNEPWVFLCGDDVKFHSGWLDQAVHIASDKYTVVGTNDLGNPRVMAGEHATHMLISRQYIVDVGASWDGPDVICHEGYRHNFVDDEIVTAAKQRGVWAFAMASKVEHLHPIFHKGKHDQVYTLGEQSFVDDREIFRKRLEARSI